jgi:hypothetical protein
VRNKVILIKGYAGVARHITLAEFERINADHVVVICAMRRPQFLPPTVKLDLSTIELKVSHLLEYWTSIEQDHFVLNEYADVLNDHGGGDVKVVEGESLLVPWFYEVVKAMHKSKGQHIVDARVVTDRPGGLWLDVDGQVHPLREALDRLRPLDYLG